MSQGNQVLEPTGPHFGMRSERVNGHHHVRVEGEMDLSVIGLVDREMERVEASDATRIVLDLGQLEFIDASGIRLLLHLTARSAGSGRRLHITGHRAPQVRRVLDLTGAGELLPLVD